MESTTRIFNTKTPPAISAQSNPNKTKLEEAVQLLISESQKISEYKKYIANSGYQVDMIFLNKTIIECIERLSESEFIALQNNAAEHFCNTNDNKIPCILWNSHDISGMTSRLIALSNYIISSQENTEYDIFAMIGLYDFTNTDQMHNFTQVVAQIPEKIPFSIIMMNPGLFIGQSKEVEWNGCNLKKCNDVHIYGSIGERLLLSLPPTKFLYATSTLNYYPIKNMVPSTAKTYSTPSIEHIITNNLALEFLPKSFESICLNNILVNHNITMLHEEQKKLTIEISIDKKLNFDLDHQEFIKTITSLKKAGYSGVISWDNPASLVCEDKRISKIQTDNLSRYTVKKDPKALKRETILLKKISKESLLKTAEKLPSSNSHEEDSYSE